MNSPLRFAIFAIILALALTACVRPLQEEDPPTPTPDPAQVVPTTAPVEPPPTEPEGGEETAPPTEGEGATEGESGTGEETAPPTEGETEAPAGGEGSTEAPQGGGETQPPPTTSTGETIHIVQPGENLFRIGLRYGIPYQTLAAYNGIPNPHLIYVGQPIKIPPSG